jgi:hypothetical protein
LPLAARPRAGSHAASTSFTILRNAMSSPRLRHELGHPFHRLLLARSSSMARYRLASTQHPAVPGSHTQSPLRRRGDRSTACTFFASESSNLRIRLRSRTNLSASRGRLRSCLVQFRQFFDIGCTPQPSLRDHCESRGGQTVLVFRARLGVKGGRPGPAHRDPSRRVLTSATKRCRQDARRPPRHSGAG